MAAACFANSCGLIKTFRMCHLSTKNKSESYKTPLDLHPQLGLRPSAFRPPTDALSRELTKAAGRPIWHRPVIVGRRGASAGHRLCEFQKSWQRPGVVRRADARTMSAGGNKYV